MGGVLPWDPRGWGERSRALGVRGRELGVVVGCPGEQQRDGTEGWDGDGGVRLSVLPRCGETF